MKMKSTKRIFSLALAVFLLVAMIPLGASAANDGTITITNATPGKTYDIYRVFDVTYTGTGADKLYIYKMNSHFVPFFQDTYKGEFGNDASKVTDEVAAAKVAAMNAAEINTFATKVQTYALQNAIAPVATKTAVADGDKQYVPLQFVNLEHGYYLMYPQGGLSAACSLTTTDPDADVVVKTKYPTMSKIINDGGSSRNVTITKAVGDQVNFELESTIPDMIGYSKYDYVVKDVMSKGLTFNDDIVIKIGTTPLVENTHYTIATNIVGGQTEIKVTFINFLQYANRTGEKLLITYSAEVNANAVLGGTGNTNMVTLEYSNNPSDSSSKDTSPDTGVRVYSYKFEVEKVDKADSSIKLQDAKFSLWTETAIAGAPTKQYDDPVNGMKTLYLFKDNMVTDSSGLTDTTIKRGWYYLFEEEAPADYNLLDAPIVFWVSPLMSPNGGQITGVNTSNPEVTYDVNTGVLKTVIGNSKGVKLPSTGGMGITLFVIAGVGLMVLATSVLVISKRKTARGKRSK